MLYISDVNFVEYFIKGKNTKSIQLTQVGAYFPKEEMNFSDSVEITGSISSEEFSGKYIVLLFINSLSRVTLDTESYTV